MGGGGIDEFDGFYVDAAIICVMCCSTSSQPSPVSALHLICLTATLPLAPPSSPTPL